MSTQDAHERDEYIEAATHGLTAKLIEAARAFYAAAYDSIHAADADAERSALLAMNTALARLNTAIGEITGYSRGYYQAATGAAIRYLEEQTL